MRASSALSRGQTKLALSQPGKVQVRRHLQSSTHPEMILIITDLSKSEKSNKIQIFQDRKKTKKPVRHTAEPSFHNSRCPSPSAKQRVVHSKHQTEITDQQHGFCSVHTFTCARNHSLYMPLDDNDLENQYLLSSILPAGFYGAYGTY
jgi:hypothetical protein